MSKVIKLPALLICLFFLMSPLRPAMAHPPEERLSENHSSTIALSTVEDVVNIYFFWGEGCPYCEMQKPFLQDLANRYPQVVIKSFEIYNNLDNRTIFFEMATKAGFEPQAVPTTFIGSQHYTGFSEALAHEIEAAVVACIQSPCPDPGMGIPGTGVVPEKPEEPVIETPVAPIDDPPEEDSNIISIPLIGDINLDAQSLVFSTAIIAFVDGFNPCSLWVLSILLALVIHSGSRRRILLVGGTFLLVTAAVYGIFIAGLFTVFTYVSFLGWIQIAVAMLALGFALVNIKDYFWYKEGVSFTISDKHKPKIYSDIRSVLSGNKSAFALIAATVAMALGIALVELPCTAGFPVLWSNLLSAHGVTTSTFTILLGLYMLIYLLDELFIFIVAVVTLKASKMEEKHGRVLKLVGGSVMMALAIVLLVNPDLMNNFGSSLLVFTAAFGTALLVLILHRTVLPRLGINIGTEFKQRKSKPRRRKAVRN
jgi:thiol-disulfide isomerase/thioredoxin